MALDLLGLFSNSNTKAQNLNTSEQPDPVLKAKINAQVAKEIRSLQVGSTIQGEVVSVKGDEISLALKNLLLQARVDQNISLSKGDVLSFQVKSNTQNGLALSPLFINTATDPNAAKALQMAGLPVNEKNLLLTGTLMEKGMPIDKNSLLSLHKEMMLHAESEVRDIVTLRQMQIPITSEHLEQLQHYENSQHYLADTFSEIGESLTAELENWIANNDTDKAVAFLNELSTLMEVEADDAGEIAAERNILSEKEAVGNSLGEGRQVLTKENIEEETGVSQKSGQLSLELEAKAELAKEIDSLRESITANKENSVIEKNTLVTENSQGSSSVKDGNPIQDQKSLALSTEEKQVVENKEIHTADLLRNLAKAVEEGADGKEIGKLFSKTWSQTMKENWLLEPKQVEEKEEVKDYYGKLAKQSAKLENLVKAFTGTESASFKEVHNTTSNLDFMNQVNQMYTYLQLPLKLQNQNGNGELYVYTNKKNLAKDNGEITALLHLGMDHLGNMDIFISLKNGQDVSTKFYLEKEEYLDFLESKMDILTSRLEKRGYTCEAKALLREEMQNSSPIDKMMEGTNSIPAGTTVLSKKAFDVRA